VFDFNQETFQHPLLAICGRPLPLSGRGKPYALCLSILNFLADEWLLMRISLTRGRVRSLTPAPSMHLISSPSPFTADCLRLRRLTSSQRASFVSVSNHSRSFVSGILFHREALVFLQTYPVTPVDFCPFFVLASNLFRTFYFSFLDPPYRIVLSPFTSYSIQHRFYSFPPLFLSIFGS